MDIEDARLAAQLLADQNNYSLRSCWNCNPAHEYLKNSTLLCCFDCGHWYYKGLDITEDSDA